MARKAMDGFPFKGRELLVKAPMSVEERTAMKEQKEQQANAKDLALKLRKTKQPTVCTGTRIYTLGFKL